MMNEQVHRSLIYIDKKKEINMSVLQEVEDFVREFNLHNDEDFDIDSIRVEFSKQHKLKELKKLGRWKKIQKHSNILAKLKRRLIDNEVTSAWRLENYNIYYYNMQDAPKYRKATLVIFGMKQYHKEPPPKELISKVLSVMKNISNIDVCLDLPYKPDLGALAKYFTLTPYITNTGVLTETRYINNTGIPMIDKIIIYDKGFKNKLESILWRLEAKISIPDIRVLALPLYEFKGIINIARRVVHD